MILLWSSDLSATMLNIYLKPPQIQGQTATFRWEIVPETTLYRRKHFSLEFPVGVDLSRVPERLWWDIFLICLHAHWLVLRPCEINLPLRLTAGETNFWLQVLRNGADTLDARRGASLGASLGIAIRSGQREMSRSWINGEGYGTAFSGGKDSLLQTGLLTELTERPLLVATTSPMPPLSDHETERRRQVLANIQARRRVRFVEVRSDLRLSWDNGFASKSGYGIAINELSDTHLYFASLLAAGAALGVTRLFLASEAEVQENVDFGGVIVQHSHFMYSAATQRALSSLLAPYGVRYGSLTWPLYSNHVQELLWSRYGDLADLQYSCWRVGPGEATCSACAQCLRIAMNALACGHDPQRMGIDLERVLKFARSWQPTSKHVGALDMLPNAIVSRRFAALVFDTIRRTSPLRMGLVLARRNPHRLFKRSVWHSISDFRDLRRRASSSDAAPRIGVREAFCKWLDPALRDRVTAIFTHHLPIEPKAEHLGVFQRSTTLAERAAAWLA